MPRWHLHGSRSTSSWRAFFLAMVFWYSHRSRSTMCAVLFLQCDTPRCHANLTAGASLRVVFEYIVVALSLRSGILTGRVEVVCLFLSSVIRPWSAVNFVMATLFIRSAIPMVVVDSFVLSAIPRVRSCISTDRGQCLFDAFSSSPLFSKSVLVVAGVVHSGSTSKICSQSWWRSVSSWQRVFSPLWHPHGWRPASSWQRFLPLRHRHGLRSTSLSRRYLIAVVSPRSAATLFAVLFSQQLSSWQQQSFCRCPTSVC